jgi:hypothetical protein
VGAVVGADEEEEEAEEEEEEAGRAELESELEVELDYEVRRRRRFSVHTLSLRHCELDRRACEVLRRRFMHSQHDDSCCPSRLVKVLHC